MKVRLIEPMYRESSYSWLIDLGGKMVGVNDQVGWCVRVDDRVVVLDEERKFVPLGPLLDMPEAYFSAFLIRAAALSPAQARLIQAFPKEMLLKHIFHTSFSSYWPERAINWLVADQKLWPRFRDELSSFSVNKVMPQAARQQAQRMLRATET